MAPTARAREPTPRRAVAARSLGEGVWSVRSRRFCGSPCWLDSRRPGMVRGADLGSAGMEAGLCRLVRPASPRCCLADDASSRLPAVFSSRGSAERRLEVARARRTSSGPCADSPRSAEFPSDIAPPRRGSSAERPAGDDSTRPGEFPWEVAPVRRDSAAPPVDCFSPRPAELPSEVASARRDSAVPPADCDSPRPAELSSEVGPARRASAAPSADVDASRLDELSAEVAPLRRGESAGLADLGASPLDESAERPAEAVPRRPGESAGSDFARLASRRARARAAALRSARLGRRGPAGRPGVSGAESPSEGSGVGGVIARDASKDRSRRGDSRAASTRPERTSR